ncbi:MAG: HD domain-containing protein [Gammaproteobacteria bacterium]
MLSHLSKLLEEAQQDQTTDSALGEARLYSEQAIATRGRTDCALLFGALQDSEKPEARDVWRTFCQDFISGEITTDAQPPAHTSLFEAQPTETHQWIADLVVTSQAQCISLNFDGLTRKAIDNMLRSKNGSGKCVILDTAEKITNFIGRDPRSNEAKHLRSIIKLRGDVFYAICVTPGCPLSEIQTPVYDLPTSDPKQRLTCPECKCQRNLQIAFPGHHDKERESEAILDAAWRYLVPSTSLFMIMGFSGEWDGSVVEFVFSAAQLLSVPVIDVRIKPDEESSHYIKDIWCQRFPRVEYQPIYCTADEFATRAANNVSARNNAEVIAVVGCPVIKPKPLPADHIWDTRGTDVRPMIGQICAADDFRSLENYSQLGLKTFWWGAVGSFQLHDRYHHSIGTMRVASRWHGCLTDCAFSNDLSRASDRENEFLAIAALLHDYGHLPFSHLFEEIFDELHWTTVNSSGKPWHEVLTHKKIRELVAMDIAGKQDAVKMYTEYLGFTVDQLLSLIDGCLGKPYLDALVNSPLDADKIDYVFRDLYFLEMAGKLEHRRLGNSVGDPIAWRDDFFREQELSPEQLIRLNGRSALRLLELLETRRNLYFKFYLSPEMRVMERITAFVMTNYLAHVISRKLGDEIRDSDQPFEYDHGDLKVRLATDNILGKYDNVMINHSTNKYKELPLLGVLLEELLEDGFPIDDVPREVLKKLKDTLNRFPKDRDEGPFGVTVRDVYKDLHVGGPYYFDSSHEGKIRDMVRELTLLYQGSVLFDVVKTPRFLAGAKTRRYRRLWANGEVIGETFLVPSINPMKWTVKTRAAVPLGAVDFGQLERQYLQVIVFDPLGYPTKARFVDQEFRRRCRASGVDFMDTITSN